MSNEQRLRDYYDQSNPVAVPAFVDAKLGGGLGAVAGAVELGRRYLKDKKYFDPLLHVDITQGASGLEAAGKKLFKPLVVGSAIGTGLGIGYGIHKHLMPEVNRYRENKDLPGAAAASIAKVDTDIPAGVGGAAGFYAGMKSPRLPKAIAAKHPIISLMAPIVAGSIAGSYAGKKLGEKYNQVAIDKISDHYYGQNKQAETYMSNKYLEKIAAAVDKSNPVYQKMRAKSDESVERNKTVAYRKETEAMPKTPAQQRMQDVLDRRAVEEANAARAGKVSASHAKMQGLIQGRKDAAHAEFESGNKYLERAQQIRATHTPPNAAGARESISARTPAPEMPPLRQGQGLIPVNQGPEFVPHTPGTHLPPNAAGASDRFPAQPGQAAPIEHGKGLTTVHSPVNARAVPGETVDGGVEAASRLGQKLRGLIPKTTLGRVAAGAIGAAGLAGAGYGVSHRGQQA